MDPAAIIEKVVHEVALDSHYGMSEAQLWAILADWLPNPVDDALKQAVTQWISHTRELSRHDGKLYASESAQWAALTGLPSGEEGVLGKKAVEVLTLVAHHRHAGLTTVQISKITGQDARLLYSRIHVLLQMGLIYRFPVIEAGCATNHIVFHEFVTAEQAKEQPTDQSAERIDKTLLRNSLVEFCAEGPTTQRLFPVIVDHLSSKWPKVKRSKLRNAIRTVMADLEQQKCLRPVTFESPRGHRFSGVEFLKSPEAAQDTQRGIVDADGLIITTPEDDDEDDELGDVKVELDSTWHAVDKGSVLANFVFTLPAQLFDLIREYGSRGVSTMELGQRLTGLKYSRSLRRYLELMTAKKTGYSELEYLSVVRGVDFIGRVKFYRYFTKEAFTKETNPNWGDFPPMNASKPPLSLLELELKTFNPVRLNCMVIRQNGVLKPVFRGDMVLDPGVEIVLKSEPSRRDSLNMGKKRGRPRKVPLPEPTSKSHEPDKAELLWAKLAELAVPMTSRSWHGGSRLVSEPASVYLRKPAPEVIVIDEEDEPVKAPEESSSSYAMQQRFTTFLEVLDQHNGVVQAGTWLSARFNEQCSSQTSMDRRTLNNMLAKLVDAGKIGFITLNVPLPGRDVLRKIYYDKQKITDPDTDERVLACKQEVLTGTKGSARTLAMRVASDLAKQAVPVRQMSQEELDKLRPHTLPGRIMSVSKGGRVSTQKKKKYGPSASEVLGVNEEGEPQAKRKKGSKTKRTNAMENESAASVEEGSEEAEMRNEEAASGEYGPEASPEASPAASETVYRRVAAKPAKPTKAKPAKTSEAKAVPAVQLDIPLEELARRVIVYKAFMPRRGAAIDWNSVVFGTKLSAAEARKHWPEARKQLWASRSPQADSEFLPSEGFEDLFVRAFERGEIGMPDTSDLKAILPQLVKWWVAAEQREKDAEMLVEADMEADAELKSSVINAKLQNLKLKPRRESRPDPLGVLQSLNSIVSAEKLLKETPFGITAVSAEAARFSDVELKVRAVVAADPDTYSAHLATQELPNDEAAVKQAMTSLENKKVIQWAESDRTKTPVGRPYILSEMFMAALTVHKTGDHVFEQAAECIRSSLKPKTVPILPTIDESHVIAIVDMITNSAPKSRIKRKSEKFGMISEEYNSRTIDKQAFECELEFATVQRKPKKKFKFVAAPRSANENRPFIWQTKFLTGHNIWRLIVGKLFSIVVFRPGVQLVSIAFQLRAALETEEVAAALAAMVEGGALEGDPSGYFVSPDWYYSMAGQVV